MQDKLFNNPNFPATVPQAGVPADVLGALQAHNPAIMEKILDKLRVTPGTPSIKESRQDIFNLALASKRQKDFISVSTVVQAAPYSGSGLDPEFKPEEYSERDRHRIRRVQRLMRNKPTQRQGQASRAKIPSLASYGAEYLWYERFLGYNAAPRIGPKSNFAHNYDPPLKFKVGTRSTPGSIASRMSWETQDELRKGYVSGLSAGGLTGPLTHNWHGMPLWHPEIEPPYSINDRYSIQSLDGRRLVPSDEVDGKHRPPTPPRDGWLVAWGADRRGPAHNPMGKYSEEYPQVDYQDVLDMKFV